MIHFVSLCLNIQIGDYFTSLTFKYSFMKWRPCGARRNCSATEFSKSYEPRPAAESLWKLDFSGREPKQLASLLGNVRHCFLFLLFDFIMCPSFMLTPLSILPCQRL